MISKVSNCLFKSRNFVDISNIFKGFGIQVHLVPEMGELQAGHLPAIYVGLPASKIPLGQGKNRKLAITLFETGSGIL